MSGRQDTVRTFYRWGEGLGSRFAAAAGLRKTKPTVILCLLDVVPPSPREDPSAFVGCYNLHFGGNSLKIGDADLEETGAEGVTPSVLVLDEAQFRYERS